MNGPGFLVLILVVSALICGWDVYNAVRGQGNTILSWVLAVLMALIALSSLRKLVRKDYSNSWW